METNKIYQGDALQVLKTFPDENIEMQITSPPYWALRDYGNINERIWDGDANCEHEWEEAIQKINRTMGMNKREQIEKGNQNSKFVKEWDRPSRREFSNRTIFNICPVCKKEFEAKPNQKFCSIDCLNTLSNEERQITENKSNFCKKCGAWKGQLGLEPNFNLYIKHLCDIFDEVKRVLKKDGTCWVNLGDTYSGDGSGQKDTGKHNYPSEVMCGTGNKPSTKTEIKNKNLCNIPARFSIEMQNRGWILRNVIIWHKPNAMPCSVKDRFTIDFEYLFFFVKNRKYYFEQQLEPHKLESIKRACRGRTSEKLDDGQYATSYKQEYQGYDNMIDRLKNGEIRGVGANGRNKRTVWTIPTKGFSGAHFAIFPEELIESPVKACCPKDGIVMDIFFGSGTTGVVALKNSKKFLGIELNPEYVKIAEERLKPFLIQTKLNGGKFFSSQL